MTDLVVLSARAYLRKVSFDSSLAPRHGVTLMELDAVARANEDAAVLVTFVDDDRTSIRATVLA